MANEGSRHYGAHMDPARRFATLVSGPPTGLSLDQACALMAAAFTGVYRYDEVMRGLDDLAARAGEPSLRGVLGVMRGRLTGNVADYYDPRNSFIDDVLARGLGLPITLSVVAIEVGRRLGAPIVGIGLPGHFMVRGDGTDEFGDPFHNGAVFDRSGLVERWDQLVGGGQRFDDLHLVPVSERLILIRMLNNLRAIFVQRGEPRALYALAVMRSAFAELADEAPQHARWVRTYN
jgi:regulator of sirC expression with transglutaminase-like and TPR domain